MANRGVNGIDGIISTALGASMICDPLVLVIGDLSFYHDLNGLLAAKLHELNITIVVVNNDGGVFSHSYRNMRKRNISNRYLEHRLGLIMSMLLQCTVVHLAV